MTERITSSFLYKFFLTINVKTGCDFLLFKENVDINL